MFVKGEWESVTAILDLEWVKLNNEVCEKCHIMECSVVTNERPSVWIRGRNEGVVFIGTKRLNQKPAYLLRSMSVELEERALEDISALIWIVNALNVTDIPVVLILNTSLVIVVIEAVMNTERDEEGVEEEEEITHEMKLNEWVSLERERERREEDSLTVFTPDEKREWKRRKKRKRRCR